jgi:hypothetical protein
MIASLTILALSMARTGAMPDAVKSALESQLSAWAQVAGAAAASSVSQERIAVERTSGSTLHIFLLERKVKAVVVAEGERSWLTDLVWCGADTGRCEDVWNRPDEKWRSDKSTANHTGYAVYRDSLRLSTATWKDPVLAAVFGKKAWDKGLCEGGLCFYASTKDSAIARAAFRPDGSVLWWDLDRVHPGSAQSVIHAFGYLRDKGRAVSRP